MRQKLLEATCGLRWQSCENVFEIGVGIVTVQPGGLKEAHGRSSATACPKRSRKEPIASLMKVLP